MTVYEIHTTTPGGLPNAVTGHAYNVALAASGGTPPYSFSAGGLPGGLSLSSSGVISGTVTSGPGRNSISLRVTDSQGVSSGKQMGIEVLGGTQFPSINLYGKRGLR